MTWTKRQIVMESLAEIGLASYDFDVAPDELQRALRRLDALAASWTKSGIRLGYPLPTSPQDADLDENTEVPDDAVQPLMYELAVQLAPGYGKEASRTTQLKAAENYRSLLSKATQPPKRQLDQSIPLGAGHKTYYRRGLRVPVIEETIDAGPDTGLDFA